MGQYGRPPQALAGLLVNTETKTIVVDYNHEIIVLDKNWYKQIYLIVSYIPGGPLPPLLPGTPG